MASEIMDDTPIRDYELVLSNEQHPLIGKTIKSLSIDESNSLLLIETDKEPISVLAEGDCCSETWFSSILGVENLINQKVTDVKQMPELCLAGTRQDSDILYGLQIYCGNQVAEIRYRNSSNGYYSGSLLYYRNYNDKRAMQPITKDIVNNV